MWNPFILLVKWVTITSGETYEHMKKFFSPPSLPFPDYAGHAGYMNNKAYKSSF